MSTLKRKLRVVIPAGIAAVTLSVASFAYACTTMGGQLFIDYCKHGGWTVPTTDPCGPIRAGDVLGVYASWVPATDGNGVPILYNLAQDQDQDGTCGNPGYFAMKGAHGLALINVANPITNTIGTDAAPIEGELRPGRDGKGAASICFSDGSYATWPENITVY